MKKKDCIIKTKVAYIIDHSQKRKRYCFGTIVSPVATRVVWDAATVAFTKPIAAAAIESRINGQPDYLVEYVAIKDLFSEAEGKKLQQLAKLKESALDDEFQAIKKQVVKKAEAAAVSIEEANQLLTKDRNLVNLTWLPEVERLKAAIADSGWCASNHNC